jgi:hypothetical protein
VLPRLNDISDTKLVMRETHPSAQLISWSSSIAESKRCSLSVLAAANSRSSKTAIKGGPERIGRDVLAEAPASSSSSWGGGGAALGGAIILDMVRLNW